MTALPRTAEAGGPGPGTVPFRCSDVARSRGDSLVGTAAPTTRWLLVEHPGPWGRDALLESRLDRDVAVRLAARAGEAGVRVLLVRRPGRASPAGKADGRLRWGYADSRPGQERLVWGTYRGPAELLDVPLDGSAASVADDDDGEGERTGGGRAYLVCTHGRHDQCCALRGRPVAAALAAVRPEQTWECSHVGGDRFAANLLLLPHGFVHGSVEPGEALTVVDRYEQGRVVASSLRGRAGLSPAAQAAQHFARRRHGLLGVADLRPLGTVLLDEDVWRVRLEAPGGVRDVVVTARHEPVGTALTCGAATGTSSGTVRVWSEVEPSGTA